MSERVRATKKRAHKQTRDESLEAGLEAMYNRNRGRLVALAKAESKGTPEWQKNVALATNTAGALAGPAAVYMAVRQARSKKGGMPRAGVEAVEAKSKPTTRLGRAARATGKVMRNPKAIAAGGAVAIGAQVANTSGDVIAARFLAEDKKKGKAMKMPNSGSLNTGYGEVSKGLPSIARGYGHKNVTNSKAEAYLLDRMDRHDRGRRNAADISEMNHGIKLGRSTQRLSGGSKRKMRIKRAPTAPREIALSGGQTERPSPFAGVKGARAAGGDGFSGDPVRPMRKTVITQNGYADGSREMINRTEGKPTLTWATRIPMFPKSGPRAGVIQKMSNVGKRMSAEEYALSTTGGVVGGAIGAYAGGAAQRGGRKFKAGARARFEEAKAQIDGTPPQPRRIANVTSGGMSFKTAREIMGTNTAAQLKARGMAANARNVLRRDRKGLIIGGVIGAGLGTQTKKDPVNKSIEQSLISKSDAVVITGHGNSLVEKRNFNAEADRQRRLGLYAGAGLGAGAVLGDAARRRMPRVEEELKDGRKIKRFDMPKGRRGRLTLAALAGGAALGAGGGASAYRRGISERNNTYL